MKREKLIKLKDKMSKYQTLLTKEYAITPLLLDSIENLVELHASDKEIELWMKSQKSHLLRIKKAIKKIEEYYEK